MCILLLLLLPLLHRLFLLFYTQHYDRRPSSSPLFLFVKCICVYACVLISKKKIPPARTVDHFYVSRLFFVLWLSFTLLSFIRFVFGDMNKILVTKIDRFKGCNYSNLCGCTYNVCLLFVGVGVVLLLTVPLLNILLSFFVHLILLFFSFRFFLISYSMQHHHAKSFWISNAPCALLINENERLARNIVLRMCTFSKRTNGQMTALS